MLARPVAQPTRGSALFLTHSLRDDCYDWASGGPEAEGQNGIWGDLLTISEEGSARFGAALAHYKQVRDEITCATLRRTGDVAGSPEIYEKVDPATGRSVVSAFANASGRDTYSTKAIVAEGIWHNGGVTVTTDTQDHAALEMSFYRTRAELVFFGIQE